jgi:hypothetical protein
LLTSNNGLVVELAALDELVKWLAKWLAAGILLTLFVGRSVGFSRTRQMNRRGLSHKALPYGVRLHAKFYGFEWRAVVDGKHLQ